MTPVCWNRFQIISDNSFAATLDMVLKTTVFKAPDQTAFFTICAADYPWLSLANGLLLGGTVSLCDDIHMLKFLCISATLPCK